MSSYAGNAGLKRVSCYGIGINSKCDTVKLPGNPVEPLVPLTVRKLVIPSVTIDPA